MDAEDALDKLTGNYDDEEEQEEEIAAETEKPASPVADPVAEPVKVTQDSQPSNTMTEGDIG